MATERSRITAVECNELREIRREGISLSELEDECGYSQDSITPHIRKECRHYDGGSRGLIDDPAYRVFRRRCLQETRLCGAESWTASAKHIASETPLSAKQVSTFITHAQEHDPALSFDRWGGDQSAWIIRSDGGGEDG